jgi:hypothetical protein
VVDENMFYLAIKGSLIKYIQYLDRSLHSSMTGARLVVPVFNILP